MSREMDQRNNAETIKFEGLCQGPIRVEKAFDKQSHARGVYTSDFYASCGPTCTCARRMRSNIWLIIPVESRTCQLGEKYDHCLFRQ